MEGEKKDRGESVKLLVEEFGWSEVEAERFLDDQIVRPWIRVQGRFLLPLLQKLSKVGIPCSEVTLAFYVPKSRLAEFTQVARETAAAKGGFLTRPEQQGFLHQGNPKVVN